MKTSYVKSLIHASWRSSVLTLSVGFLVSACGSSSSSPLNTFNQNLGVVQPQLLSPAAGSTTCSNTQIVVATQSYGDCFQTQQMIANSIRVVELGSNRVDPIASVIANGSLSQNSCSFTLTLANGLDAYQQIAVESNTGTLTAAGVPSSLVFFTGAPGTPCQNYPGTGTPQGGQMAVTAILGANNLTSVPQTTALFYNNQLNLSSVGQGLANMVGGNILSGIGAMFGVLQKNPLIPITIQTSMPNDVAFAQSAVTVYQLAGDPNSILTTFLPDSYSLIPTYVSVQGNQIQVSPAQGYPSGSLYYVYVGTLQSTNGVRSTTGYASYFYVQ